MKKTLIIGITVLVFYALLLPTLAGAQDGWQTITLGSMTFQLPAN
ncbi:MAG TPA: hypothetical protein VLH40_01885 [Atribacteraceae bacterium]|nr:hypothetical protein [Atribacteraceae bacterium]